MVEPSPSIMIIIILITIPMLGPECKYLNGPEISFRSEAVFAACRLVGHIWDSTHIASNHLSVGQDLSANELIFVSTWFPCKRGWIWLKSSHTFVRLGSEQECKWSADGNVITRRGMNTNCKMLMLVVSFIHILVIFFLWYNVFESINDGCTISI